MRCVLLVISLAHSYSNIHIYIKYTAHFSCCLFLLPIWKRRRLRICQQQRREKRSFSGCLCIMGRKKCGNNDALCKNGACTHNIREREREREKLFPPQTHLDHRRCALLPLCFFIPHARPRHRHPLQRTREKNSLPLGGWKKAPPIFISKLHMHTRGIGKRKVSFEMTKESSPLSSSPFIFSIKKTVKYSRNRSNPVTGGACFLSAKRNLPLAFFIYAERAECVHFSWSLWCSAESKQSASVMAAHLLHDAEKEINYLTCDCTKYHTSGSRWESVKFGRKSKAISLELLIS